MTFACQENESLKYGVSCNQMKEQCNKYRYLKLNHMEYIRSPSLDVKITCTRYVHQIIPNTFVYKLVRIS